jgi:hypothetical protein
VAGPLCATATVDAEVPDEVIEITSNNLTAGTRTLVGLVSLQVPNNVPETVSGTLQLSGDGLTGDTGFTISPGQEKTFRFDFNDIDPGNYELCAEVTDASVGGREPGTGPELPPIDQPVDQPVVGVE